MSESKWYPGKFLFQILGQRAISSSEVKEKTLELARKMGVEDKVVFGRWFPSQYDIVRDRIEINPELVADYLNDLLEIFPSVDWQKNIAKNAEFCFVLKAIAYAV
jgi:hypothetical protein